jgi:hypothetical protein
MNTGGSSFVGISWMVLKKSLAFRQIMCVAGCLLALIGKRRFLNIRPRVLRELAELKAEIV